MKSIRIEGVTKYFHGEPVLKNIHLTIPSGSFFTLLGPSGSGKTTLLRLIAGFETVDAGAIYLGDQEITHLPPHQRKINTVFQHYALFPHLNVFENVAFGLRIKGLPQPVVEQKVMKMLRAVHLDGHAHKKISQLSGGQQQRIALSRAIVNEPEVLLLDEPLAALDLSLRERMLVELIELQEQFRTTFMYVTHDQLEALAVSHKMAIMNHHGDVEQIGSPKEIYEFPISSFAAQFVGSTNLFEGKIHVKEDGVFLHVPELGLMSVAVAPGNDEWVMHDMPALLSVRPEKIEITKQSANGFSNYLKGRVEAILYYGRSTQYRIVLDNEYRIHVFEQNEEHFPRETIVHHDTVYLYWQKDNAVLLRR